MHGYPGIFLFYKYIKDKSYENIRHQMFQN